MLKAKLVVKQGQKVMGLYAKDCQTAHLKNKGERGDLHFLAFDEITRSKDSCEKTPLFLLDSPDFSFC